ncbi:MAG: hypothetical protein WC829_20590, partial [Hyphomicrobium sp.]
PSIPGVPPHPVQIAEQQRIASLHPDGVEGATQSQRTTSSLMSDQTRDALRKVSQALRKAGGLPASDVPTAPTNTGSNPTAPAPPSPSKRRVDATNPTDPRRTTLGVAQQPLDGTSPSAVP